MSYSIAVTNSANAPLAGVRGWLLFLCISLVFLGPARSVSNVMTPFRSDVITSNRDLLYIFICGSIPAVISTVLSIAAGISLWTVRPYAIKLTYAFMVFAVLAECILAPWIFTSTLDMKYADTIDLGGVGRMLVCIAISGTYLARSKRVRNTFAMTGPGAT